MANVRKSITLTESDNAWLEAQVTEGRYQTTQDAIRGLIRLDRARGAEIEAATQALSDGEERGDAAVFDFVAFKQLKAAQQS